MVSLLPSELAAFPLAVALGNRLAKTSKKTPCPNRPPLWSRLLSLERWSYIPRVDRLGGGGAWFYRGTTQQKQGELGLTDTSSQ